MGYTSQQKTLEVSMPWKETAPVLERAEFVRLAASGRYPFTQLCELFAISRKTGYKRLRLYEELGWQGLEDQSRAAHTHPNATARSLCRRIVAVRRKYADWGPEKIIDFLTTRYPDVAWPAVSTAGEILDRAGLIKKRKRRPRSVPGKPRIEPVGAPNELWNLDLMGRFRTGDGQPCHTLTATDSFSRALLICKGLLNPTHANARAELERCFKRYGLPVAIRCDNGEPFITYRGLAGLSRLSVWLIKLGIQQIRTRPGRPQDNGLHERMHRTIRSKAARPPASCLAAQQPRLNAIRRTYNYIRPHRALNGKTPMSLYQPSERRFPKKLPQLEYPGHFEVRKVRANGDLLWKSTLIFLSEVFAREPVGLEERDDGIWSIYVGPVMVAILDERRKKIISNRV